jgi:hypothetical protein
MGRACSSCAAILDGSAKAGLHHPQAALVQRGLTGCPLCSFVWDHLTKEERVRIREADKNAFASPELSEKAKLSNISCPYSISEAKNPDEYTFEYTFLDKRDHDDTPAIIKIFTFSSEKGLRPSFVPTFELFQLTDVRSDRRSWTRGLYRAASTSVGFAIEMDR